ncbi:hypothetical protein Syun_004534 [Stephania yunnanensis]|uniref:Uncharacterized protein n=1 Tax=Stephania yunnanensis TaxID=152371 RepID=A0AAP0L378_9MAGN
MVAATSCSSIFNLKSTAAEPRMGSATTYTAGAAPASCAKLDSVAMWFINGVATVFFASLERCSCMHIATEDDGDEANDMPLISNDGNFGRDGGTVGSRRRTGKGKIKRGGFLMEDFHG